MIRSILNFHVAPITPTKFRLNLTYGQEKMVFEKYQDGYTGSHIIYPNRTCLAFMNLYVLLDSHRIITFLHLIPEIPHFSLPRFP